MIRTFPYGPYRNLCKSIYIKKIPQTCKYTRQIIWSNRILRHLLGSLHLAENHLGGRALQVGLQRRAISPPMFDGRIWQKHAKTSDVENIIYIYIYCNYISIPSLIYFCTKSLYIFMNIIFFLPHMIQPHMYFIQYNIYIYIYKYRDNKTSELTGFL